MLRGLRKGVGAGAYVFKVPLSHSGARGSSPPPDRYNMGGQLRYKGGLHDRVWIKTCRPGYAGGAVL